MRRVSQAALVAAAISVGALALPSAALAHSERPTFFPEFKGADVPVYRTTGPRSVVCKADSKARIKRAFKGDRRLTKKRLKLLKSCRFKHIQAAVDKARNGQRILVMPGVYREEPSANAPNDDPRCKDMFVGTAGSGTRIPSYEYQLNCPKARNLITIAGDSDDADRVCDIKCDIQIEGMGRTRADVLITGERKKLNVIRADRADGIYLKRFTIEYSDFNNIYALETNGFRFDDIESRYSREYGFLSFASDNGLYENLEAYGSGDSGIYPGSGPEGHCKRYGIEIRNSDSHGNTIGYSGTAGNGVWAHDNKFHDNATGMTTDSFAAGHPGMPQDCAKWERNEIYSNNFDLFNAERDAYCNLENRPIEKRDPKVVCPTFQVPVGTGLGIFGGNGDIARDNFIYDNWRDGIKLLWVPGNFRGEEDPAKLVDTSFDNTFEKNRMGVRPDGKPDANGNDFWWDGEGSGNCWSGNIAAPDRQIKSQPSTLPACPGSPIFLPGNPLMTASQATCATWDPQTNPDPTGCDWFTRPPEPPD